METFLNIMCFENRNHLLCLFVTSDDIDIRNETQQERVQHWWWWWWWWWKRQTPMHCKNITYGRVLLEKLTIHSATQEIYSLQWVPGDLSLGVKRPGREAYHSPPSSTEVKEWVELYFHSPNTPSWNGAHLKHRNNFTLPYSRNLPPFMEPEGSIPWSHDPATGIYPELDEYRSHFLTLFV
jgi:hypothetical protein